MPSAAGPTRCSDLPPDIHKRAQAICAHARVRNDTLLGACTIDVAVLGKRAAQVYRGMPAPVADGNDDGDSKQPGQTPRGHG